MASRGNSNVIWYLPYGLEVLIFTVMFSGVAWAVLVWLINFPPQTWSRPSWLIIGGAMHVERETRPLDKPSKYTKRVEGEANGHDSTTSAKAPGMYVHDNEHIEEQGIELKHRRHKPTEHRRSHSNPSAAIRFDIPSPPCVPIDSPPNPFLHLPEVTYLSPPHRLQPRSSSEWLAQHAAFFSSTASNASRAPSYCSDDYDMEVLEAGTAPLTPKSVAVKTYRTSMSWMDLGLGKVEGAVNGFVGKVAKWTDNDDDDDDVGEEGFLLPVVSERVGVKVEWGNGVK
jgi:hypothetical protein